MPDSQQHFPVRLTQAQRKVVAEIAPELAHRLKLDERNRRTIPFTLAELKAIKERAGQAIRHAISGMQENSLRHVLDAATHVIEHYWGTGSNPASERLQTKKSGKSPSPKPKKMSYGGVLLNDEKQVLLRRPKGDFDGYVWTFPKGKGEPGASPEDTALREVKEETGYTAEIVGKIPGQFEGGSGSTEYFVMRPLGEPAPFDQSETEAIAWVSLDDAVNHIAQTRNEIGRRRDQSVLAAVNRYLGEHATRFSWRITDMPAKKARLPFGMRFSPGEVARLRKGHIPHEMEDKWFIFFENDWLNFHRSWTGYCIYRLRLEPDGECYRVAEAWVNRDSKQYTNKKLATDEKHLLALLFYRFAIGSEPPSDL
jgi:8-oxo-dGTP pyrophosphatase MutT (NUDIX family)